MYELLGRREHRQREYSRTQLFSFVGIHNSTTDAVCALETSPKTKQRKIKQQICLDGVVCVCQHQRCDLHVRCVGCNLQRRRLFYTENRHRSFAHKVERKLAATEHWIMVFFFCLVSCLIKSALIFGFVTSKRSIFVRRFIARG